MKQQELISVIIPVYKAEKYLPTCLESVLTQTYQNLEVILVDDGSPDNSGAVCDEYAAKDRRVRVIHQKNGGASAARNAGLDAAKGAYIGFVDADDHIAPDMYQVLYERICETGADIAQCGYEDNRPEYKEFIYGSGEDRVYNGTQCVEKLLRFRAPWWTLWSKLCRAELFQGLRLSKELRTSEDAFLGFQLFSKIDRLVFVKRPLYHWIWRPVSLSKTSTASLDTIKVDRYIAEHVERTFPHLTGYGYQTLAHEAAMLFEVASLLSTSQHDLQRELQSFLCITLSQTRSKILRSKECGRTCKIKTCFISLTPHLYDFLFPIWLKATKWRRKRSPGLSY